MSSYKDIAVGQKICMTSTLLSCMESEECIVVNILNQSILVPRGKDDRPKIATSVYFWVRPTDKDTVDLVKAWNKKKRKTTAAHATDIVEIRLHQIN